MDNLIDTGEFFKAASIAGEECVFDSDDDEAVADAIDEEFADDLLAGAYHPMTKRYWPRGR